MTTFPRAEPAAGAPAARSGAGELLARVDRLAVDVRGSARGSRGGSAGPFRILDDVALSVREGEFVAIVGPSGCGKSTLLRAVAGLLPPSVVTSAGSTVEVALAGDRPDVAWMPQRDSLLPWRRAWSNAMLGARIARRDEGAAQARAGELFERFGLAGFERSWPHELSGGMRQRLALLRTVLADRRLLLLDEPFSGLDALTRRRMNAWLRDVDLVRAGSRRGAVVLVTHDVDEAVLLADRVVVLAGPPGRVVDTLKTGELSAVEARGKLLDLLGVRG